jgi:hypothetical protein
MTISDLIEVLRSREDEFGDVPVELLNGKEVFAVGAVFGTPKKGEETPVVAVSVQ